MHATTRPSSFVAGLCLAVLGLLPASAIHAAAPAPSPEPQPEPQGVKRAEVDGGLDRAAVREVVRARIADVRGCYNTELLDDPAVAGRIVLAFTVTPAGDVREASVAESTMPARFDACVRAAVTTWAFPASERPTEIRYPFALEPG